MNDSAKYSAHRATYSRPASAESGVSHFLQFGIALIVSIAVIEKWGFYFGFNLKFYEMVVLLSAPFLLLQIGLQAPRTRLPRPLLIVILLKLLYFILVLLSVVPLISSNASHESLMFFAKGILQIGVRTAFFTLLILVLVGFSAKQRRHLVGFHLGAVSISALYGLAQGALMFWRNIDLDDVISKWLEPVTGSPGASIARYAYGALYRLPGLAGDPNLQAAYSITAVPLLTAFFLRRASWYLALLLVIHACMIALTMSLSGIFGLGLSLLIVLLNHGIELKLRNLLYGLALVALATYAYLQFEDQILYLIRVRTDPSGTATQHSDIAMESLRLYREHPFGVGYNNFSLAWRAFTTAYADRDMNPHNTFLAILVESGPLALTCEIITYALMMWIALRKRTPFSRIFFASLLGMCAAALAYETLEMFYAQLFIFIGFTCVVMGDQLWFDSSSKQRVTAGIGASAILRRTVDNEA